MNKRILSLSIAMLILVGIIGMLNFALASDSPEIVARVTMDGTLTGEIGTGEIFTVSFYVRNFDNIALNYGGIEAISVPIKYDTERVELLTNQRQPIQPTTAALEIFNINTDYFVATDNAEYPEYDTSAGNFRIHLVTHEVIGQRAELHLFSVNFRARSVGEFTLLVDGEYATDTRDGVAIYPFGDILGSAPQTVINTIFMQPVSVLIRQGQSRPPENVVIIPNVGEDYYTVVVSRNPESDQWLPYTLITLFTQETGGTQIGVPTLINHETRNAVFRIPANQMPSNYIIWAEALEPGKTVSDRVDGTLGADIYEVIAVIRNPFPHAVYVGTPKATVQTQIPRPMLQNDTTQPANTVFARRGLWIVVNGEPISSFPFFLTDEDELFYADGVWESTDYDMNVPTAMGAFYHFVFDGELRLGNAAGPVIPIWEGIEHPVTQLVSVHPRPHQGPFRVSGQLHNLNPTVSNQPITYTIERPDGTVYRERLAANPLLTDAQGRYTIIDVPAGYTVTISAPLPSDQQRHPAVDRVIIMPNNDVTDQDFWYTQIGQPLGPFTVSGQLHGLTPTVSNQPITYTITRADGTVYRERLASNPILTDEQGRYIITEVPVGYTVTINAPPPPSTQRRNPAGSRVVTMPNHNVTDQDFWYTPFIGSDGPFTISGQLHNLSPRVNNQPITYTITRPDGTVYRQRTATNPLLTDAQGRYIITEVPAGYRVVIDAPRAPSSQNRRPTTAREIEQMPYHDVIDQDFWYTPRTTGFPPPPPPPPPDPVTSITIRGVYVGNNSEIYRQVVNHVRVGTSQTGRAPDIEGFILRQNEPQTRTITTVLNAGQNIITFYYVREQVRLVDDHFRYIFGYPDGTVRPEGRITREEVATVFFRLLETADRNANRTTVHNFPDVERERWSNQQIATLTRAGILSGDWHYGTFRPADAITRAEFAVIAMRFDRLMPNPTHNLSDIRGHWAEQSIASAVQRGWVTGYPDGTFRPDQAITRVEAMTLINRMTERNVDTTGMDWALDPNWPDLPRNHWGFFQVMEATVSHYHERRHPNNAANTVENWTGRRQDVNFGEQIWIWNPSLGIYQPDRNV